jgi:hypothetical protein
MEEQMEQPEEEKGNLLLSRQQTMTTLVQK